MVNKRVCEGLTHEERAAIGKAHAEAGEYSKAVLEERASGMIGSREGWGVARVEPDVGPFVEKL
jgi:TRAP-type C4-dicarboxylate transport system substrate-binding protein